MAAILSAGAAGTAYSASAQGTPAFGPSNPFYAPSTLPFQAPPFNKITNADFQPALDETVSKVPAEYRPQGKLDANDMDSVDSLINKLREHV